MATTKKNFSPSLSSSSFILPTFIYLLTFVLPIKVEAKITHDFATWSGLFIERPLSEGWGLYLEGQNRLAQDFSSGNRMVLRPGIYYNLTPQVSLWLGAAWTPNMSPYRSELRLWQQIIFNHFLTSELPLSHRVRLEERRIEYTDQAAYRFRYMLRASGPLVREMAAMSWVVWDEYFHNLNDVHLGPKQGFDQNRMFAGVNYKLNNQAEIEPGYLHNLVNERSPAADNIFHAFVVYVRLTL